MRIAVAGGTGTVGRYVVEMARRRGHDVVVLTRSEGVDVHSGEGVERALAGADAVIDVLNTTTLSTKKTIEFFESTSGHLLAAEQKAGTAHHVTLSIVGIDDIETSYYAGKLAQERLVRASGVPQTVARAGQFHEFAAQIAARATMGALTLVPKMLTRPVGAEEVAEHLVTVAEGEPRGRAVDLVGPRDESLADMVRRMYAHDGTRRRAFEVRFPGAYWEGLASGKLRGTAPVAIGRTSFDEWLSNGRRAT